MGQVSGCRWLCCARSAEPPLGYHGQWIRLGTEYGSPRRLAWEADWDRFLFRLALVPFRPVCCQPVPSPQVARRMQFPRHTARGCREVRFPPRRGAGRLRNAPSLALDRSCAAASRTVVCVPCTALSTRTTARTVDLAACTLSRVWLCRVFVVVAGDHEAGRGRPDVACRGAR